MTTRRLLRVATPVAITLGLVLGGCGHSLPRAPTTPQADGRFTPVHPAPPTPGMDDDPPQPLTILPGDEVTLVLTSAEQRREDGFPVDERGVLHVPLAGDIQVGGLTLVDAERRIEAELRRFDRTVRVTVLLSNPMGHQATVLGAVTTPGRVPISPGMKVADLLAASGGPRLSTEGIQVPAADLGGAFVMRNGERMPISVARAVEGDPRHNVRVRPGDHLFVPATLDGLVSVIGEVSSARVFPHFAGVRLSQALALAGGFTRDANGGDIRIIRGPAESPQVYYAQIDHVAEGSSHDPILAPGDVVYVTSNAIADLRDALNPFGQLVAVLTSAATLALTAVIVSETSGAGVAATP